MSINLTKLGIFLAISSLSFSCDNMANPDQLLNQVSSDVAFAKAEQLTVSINAQGDGIVSPSGSTGVKKGFKIPIQAQALSNSGFLGWEKVNPADDIVFDDPKSAKTNAEINGANSGIKAVFDKNAAVLFSIPGNGSVVGTNSKITLFFTKSIDPTSTSTSTVLVEKLKNDGTTTTVSIGTVSISGNMMVVSPASTLATSSKFRFTLSGQVVDSIGLASDQNTTFIFDSGIGPSTNAPGSTKALFATYIKADALVAFSDLLAVDADNDPITTVLFGSFPPTASAPLLSSIYGSEISKTYVENGSGTFLLNPVTPQGWIDVAARFGDSTGLLSGIENNAWKKVYFDKVPPTASEPSITNSRADSFGAGYDTSPLSYYWIKSSTVDLNFATLVDPPNSSGTTDAAESKVVSVVLENLTGATKVPTGLESPTLVGNAPATISGWSFGSLVPITRTTGSHGITQTKNFYVLQTQTVDKVGNRSTPITTYYRLDVTPPVVTAPSPKLETKLLTFTLTIVSTDTGGSGESLGKRLYQRTGSGLASPDVSPILLAEGATIPLGFASGEGNKHVDIVVSDPVGNSAASPVSLDFKLDLTPPPMPSFSFGGATNFTGMTISIPSMSFSDAYTGVVKVEVSTVSGFNDANYRAIYDVPAGTTSLSNVTCPSTFFAGVKTVYMRVTDAAGNVSPVFSATITKI